jgi:hypothetical protein
MPPFSSPTINPVAALVTKLSGMYEALDAETLKVSGLEAASYTLKIDGRVVGAFSREQLARGINLARYDTPMMEQAYKVLTLVWHRVDIRFYGWRAIRVALGRIEAPGLSEAVDSIIKVLNGKQNQLVARAHSAAEPQEHHYELTAATQ